MKLPSLKKKSSQESRRRISSGSTIRRFQYSSASAHPKRRAADVSKDRKTRSSAQKRKTRSTGSLRSSASTPSPTSRFIGLIIGHGTITSVGNRVLVFCIVSLAIYATTMSSTNVNLYEPTDATYRSASQYVDGSNAILGKGVLRRSKLLFRSQSFEQDIRREFPEVTEVRSIVPVGGRVLNTHFVIAEPLGYVDAGQTTGVVSVDGILVSYDDVRDQSLRLDIEATPLGEQLPLGSRMLTDDEVELLQLLQSEMNDIDHPVAGVDMNIETGRINARFAGKKYSARLSARAESRGQVGALKVALKSLSEDQLPKDYIDVRISGRVFVQ